LVKNIVANVLLNNKATGNQGEHILPKLEEEERTLAGGAGCPRDEESTR
jgi:hypothetical protein